MNKIDCILSGIKIYPMGTNSLIREYNTQVTDQITMRHDIEMVEARIITMTRDLNTKINSYNTHKECLECFKKQMEGTTGHIKYDYFNECIEFLLSNSNNMDIMERLNSGLSFNPDKPIMEQFSINKSKHLDMDKIIELAHTLSYRFKYGRSSIIPDEFKSFNILKFSI